MADFKAKVVRLEIEEHPNADALELARVGDYRSVVRKGQFKTGDLGVYIPEQAVLPDWLIETLGLEGKLAGKQKNRVKAVKLRGVLSQGLIYPVEHLDDGEYFISGYADDGVGTMVNVGEGDNVTEALGITKYEPPIPVHMAGEVFNALGATLKYDIENFKHYPNAIAENELVYITEKLHGTWACFGFHPKHETPIVTSKGLSAKGLAFKFNEQNKDNLYVRTYHAVGAEIVRRMRDYFGPHPVYVLGEIFGKGVQDLAYGATEPQFRVFDVYVGEPHGDGQYVSGLFDFLNTLEIPTVPVLYKGFYSKETLLDLTDGKETVSGSGTNIREGVVVRPMNERRDDELGRVILKSVSEAYLLRKGGTEYT